MDVNSAVLKFISKFMANGQREQVIDTFSNWCCYWFAQILYNRFEREDYLWHKCYMAYDIIANHFACNIDGRVFDITGDVTDQYDWKDLSHISDDYCAVDRVVRDSILFVEIGGDADGSIE